MLKGKFKSLLGKEVSIFFSQKIVQYLLINYSRYYNNPILTVYEGITGES